MITEISRPVKKELKILRANQKVRDAAKAAGVKQWEVAVHLGISEPIPFRSSSSPAHLELLMIAEILVDKVDTRHSSSLPSPGPSVHHFLLRPPPLARHVHHVHQIFAYGKSPFLHAVFPVDKVDISHYYPKFWWTRWTAPERPRFKAFRHQPTSTCPPCPPNSRAICRDMKNSGYSIILYMFIRYSIFV